jgi:trans-aconitate methyltransferase
MRDIVVAHVPQDRRIRVLDVGCGTGALAFELASTLPQARITGVDVSAANIREAAARQQDGYGVPRVEFEQADYLRYATAPVDVIVTDTVLHFVPGRRDILWNKLHGDLRPGGLLICCMAFDCAHNRLLQVARHGLRRIRSGVLDALLLSAARRAYGHAMNDALLRERIEYMYIPPHQFMSAAIKLRLASAGLRVVAEHDVPAASATQLKQRVTVFRKD